MTGKSLIPGRINPAPGAGSSPDSSTPSIPSLSVRTYTAWTPSSRSAQDPPYYVGGSVRDGQGTIPRDEITKGVNR